MRPSSKTLIAALILALPVSLGAPDPTSAQSLVAQVNGAPITSFDVAQRERFLRVIHRPASADNAFESLVADALKQQDMKTYGVQAKPADIQNAITQTAQDVHMSVPALAAALQRAGLKPADLTNHWAAKAGFYFIVGSQNRMVEPTDAAIKAAMAAEGPSAVPIIYTLQQVTFTLPVPLTIAGLNATGRRANTFRASFSSCDPGIARAKAMPGVVVKAPTKRNSGDLNPQALALLQKVPVGHMTPVSRDALGLTMYAVCSRVASTDKDAMRNAVIAKLQEQNLKPLLAAAYAKLRARAVIQRR